MRIVSKDGSLVNLDHAREIEVIAEKHADCRVRAYGGVWFYDLYHTTEKAEAIRALDVIGRALSVDLPLINLQDLGEAEQVICEAEHTIAGVGP